MPKRQLEVELIADNKLSGTFRGAVRDADSLGSRLRHVGVLGTAALGGLVTVAAGAVYGIKQLADTAEESNKVHAQTGAVLKSTNEAANISQRGVESLAGAISRKTGIDDEAVQSGANVLLTFKEIQNQAGAGNDIFNQSTQVIVDMSTALDQDLKSSAIQVGKALNEPIKGLTALQRVGVTFSDQQSERIKQWVEEGDKIKAQKAILHELNSEFGGSAAAQATAMDKIKVSVGNVEESLGNVFLPTIEEGATKLNRDFIPELQHTANELANIADRKDIDLGEKLSLDKDVIAKDWGAVPGEIGHLVDEAIPVVAERAGHLGTVWVESMLHGFLSADPLGKAMILLSASRAFGGPAALAGLVGTGRQAGGVFGKAVGDESAVAMGTAFGLGKTGQGIMGFTEKLRSAGRFVGKVGLGLGLVEGAQAMFASKDGDIAARLGQIDSQGKGMIGSIERDSGLSGIASDLGIDSWANAGDEAHRLLEILQEINSTHGEQHTLLRQEAGDIRENLDLTEEQRQEIHKTLIAQETASKSLHEGLTGLQSGQFTRLSDVKQVEAQNAEAIGLKYAKGSQAARDATARNYDAAAKAIEVGIDRGVIKTKVGMAEITRLTRQAHLVSGDDPWGIAKGFQQSWAKAGKVTDDSLDGVEKSLGKMPPQAATAAGQMMIGMARQMRQKGQLSKSEVEKIRSAVVTKLNLMARQGGRSAETLQGNVGGSFQLLSISTAEALEAIGGNVTSVMEALGAENIPQFTIKKLLGSFGKAPKSGQYLNEITEFDHAQGGPVRVPGQGRSDTVGLSVNGVMSARVAPGEDLTVFNRHQRPLVDQALANEFGVRGLPGFFERFNTPHYLAAGGFAEPRLSGSGPLRGVGQMSIHDAYVAARRYLARHMGVYPVIRNGDRMDALHKPYLWGGGHGATPSVNGPWDCSGGTAELLDGGGIPTNPMVSGEFMNWGLPGKGAVSVLANSEHVYAVVKTPKGLRAIGTSEENSGGGYGWISGYTFRPGFMIRHADLSKRSRVGGGGRGKGQRQKKGFAEGGIVTGKVSWFNESENPGQGTAGGFTTSQPGVALNLNPGSDAGWDNDTTQAWIEQARSGHPVYAAVTIEGHSANLPITDLGPSGFTGRAIDVTEGGVRKLGFSPSDFPTDAVGKAVILGAGGKAAGKSRKERREERRQAESEAGISPGVAITAEPLHSTRLPKSAAGLSKSVKNQLRAPGITYAGKAGVSERALSQTQESVAVARGQGDRLRSQGDLLQEEGKTEEAQARYQAAARVEERQKRKEEAVLGYQHELFLGRRKKLKADLAQTEKQLKVVRDPAKQKRLLGRAEHLREELGDVQGHLSSIREERRSLHEPIEGLQANSPEEEEDPAVKAAEEAQKASEEQKAATEDLTAVIAALAKTIEQQQRNEATSEAISSREALKALADVVEERLGPRAFTASLATGIGRVGSA